LKLGGNTVYPALALAPMAGVTGHPFRLLAKEQGCGLVYSEMISARGLCCPGKRTEALLYYSEAERPVAFQLFGSEPAVLAAAAQILEERSVDLIDLNLGCPTPKITRNGDGGALMRDPTRCSAIFEAVVEAVNCPVSVKIRKGWDECSVNAPEIALRAEAAGVKAVAVHGRTVKQGYSGKADWEIIKKVKETINIPVFGNGDVSSPQDAEAMLKLSCCDGVMIGRAAMGNPWIFKQVSAWLEEGRKIGPPSPEERVEMCIRHMTLLCGFKGNAVAVREMRRHASWYIKGLPGAAEARRRLIKAVNCHDMSEILQDFSREVGKS
jgi:tRNA-dihydrouridine synthase B